MQTKICTKCGRELPATSEYFHKNKRTPDGLYYRCKKCKSEDDKEYRIRNKSKLRVKRKIQYWQNVEHNRDQTRQWALLNKEKKKTSDRQYYEKNKDRIKKYSRNHYQLNRKKHYKLSLCWRNQNPTLYGQYQKKYAHKRRLTIGCVRHDLTNNEWEKIKIAFGSNCAYCGNYCDSPTQEHFIPVSRHGEYTKHNIIPACLSCNSSKQDKPFEEWYPEQPFYSKDRELFICEHFSTMAQENDGWGRSRPDLGVLTIALNNEWGGQYLETVSRSTSANPYA